MKKISNGFSLIEMIVAMLIITLGLSAALPSYVRSMRQGEIDRYTQQLEAGFFSLRAKLGRQKTSCSLTFDGAELTNFKPPEEVVEMSRNPERMECCNSEIRAAGQASGCAYGPEIGKLLALTVSNPEDKISIERNRSLRLMEQEGTPESKAVKIAVNSSSYELTPPGTSTMANDLIFLIQSASTDNNRLRTRCLQISGTGTIFSGSWNKGNSTCD